MFEKPDDKHKDIEIKRTRASQKKVQPQLKEAECFNNLKNNPKGKLLFWAQDEISEAN